MKVLKRFLNDSLIHLFKKAVQGGKLYRSAVEVKPHTNILTSIKDRNEIYGI